MMVSVCRLLIGDPCFLLVLVDCRVTFVVNVSCFLLLFILMLCVVDSARLLFGWYVFVCSSLMFHIRCVWLLRYLCLLLCVV